MGAKKISKGVYEYKGYRILCIGYYEPEHRVCWEAVNIITDCGDYRGYTKQTIMQDIDRDLN